MLVWNMDMMIHSSKQKENPFSLREKARMRGLKLSSYSFYSLSPALPLRGRE